MGTATRTTVTLAGVLLAGAAVTATAATASAAPATHTGTARYATGARGDVVLDDASSVAGYGADLSHYTLPRQWKATATFTVPKVVCTASTTAPLFVQLFFSGTDRQGNGLGEGGWAQAYCNGTTAGYNLNISAQGGASGGVTIDTNAGDSVTMSFAATKASEVSTVVDHTTGATASQTGTGFKAVGGMQVSVQGGDAHSRFPRFSKVHFTAVTGAGQAFQALNPGSFDAVDGAGAVKIQAQPLDPSGRGFVDTFVANFKPGA